MYILSKLANDQTYIKYQKGYGNINIPASKVTVNGKADITNKSLVTPSGALTKVSDADFEILQNNPVFKEQVEAGFISYFKVKPDIEKQSSKLKRDKSAPLTSEILADKAAKRGQKAPKINV